MNQPTCVLYLRSSKDRHDVSLDTQRRQLEALAAERGLVIAGEYQDAVESGADDQRPGFQSLLHAIKAKSREWASVLVLDTSRIARRRHLALMFEHEAEKAGVAILYRSVPDTDPITGMLLRSILQAMDEWHSLTSRAKGLAGQQENIRQGWRAGGAPPRGYSLERIPTGAMREGAPVMKSKLTPNQDAPQVAAYFKARAAGKSRSIALSLAGVDWPRASLHDMERHAIIYAGHTVWGQSDSHQRRLPPSEWTIQRDTHPAIITETEALAIEAQIQLGQHRRTRQTDREYLLSGLLCAPDGQPWGGEWDSKMEAPIYRLGKGPRVSGRRIERAVLDAVFADLASEETANRIAEAMRRLADPGEAQQAIRTLTQRIETISRQIARLVDLAIEADDPAPYRRAIAEKERERHECLAERNDAMRQADQAKAARSWTAAEVRVLLRTLRAEVEAGMEREDIASVRLTLSTLIDRVEYAPGADTCRVVYRLDTGNNHASPRDRQPTPVVWERSTDVKKRVTS